MKKYSDEELLKLASDPRKLLPRAKRKPNRTVAGKVMSKLVSDKTGFQQSDIKLILAAYHETIIEQLVDKNTVEIPTIGSIYPFLKPARLNNNFPEKVGRACKTASTVASVPRFGVHFQIACTIFNKTDKMIITDQDIENLYVPQKSKK